MPSFNPIDKKSPILHWNFVIRTLSWLMLQRMLDNLVKKMLYMKNKIQKLKTYLGYTTGKKNYQFDNLFELDLSQALDPL